MRRAAAFTLWCVGLGAGVGAVGCVGQLAGPGSGSPPPPSDPPTTTTTGALCRSAAVEPGPAYIRRLTRNEYDNTLRDLLGDTSQIGSKEFPVEEKRLGFDNNAAVLSVSPLLAEKYMLVAETVAAGAVTRGIPGVAVCDTTREGIDSCGQKLIASFGRRAFRRPLTAEDVALLTSVFDAGKATDFATGARLVVQTALQAPQFLYRVEHGKAGVAAGQVAAVDGWEMAARLSYLLWNSMPDEALFAAAEAGRLSTAAEVGAQVTRMLADPRAHAAVASFHAQWLQLREIETVEKDAAVFAGFSPAIAALMRRQAETFVDHVIWRGTGTLTELLTAPFTFVNGPLARYYGMAGGPTGDAFTQVELEPGRRAGLLTQGGFLSLMAKANQTSPVYRGKFVREQLFCTDLLPPPPEVDTTAPQLSPTLTTRERFAQHSANDACAGCHSLMDPIGLGFEGFDGGGRYRATENGRAVDATGEIVLTDVAGPFDGAMELASRLAGSADVRRCVVTQWFRYAFGRAETAADACSMEAARTRFEASGGDVRELVTALTQTDAFLYRRVSAPAGATP